MKVRPVNLVGGAGAFGRVLVFWGDARWSRTQLLGELAKGDWGLGRAGVRQLTVEPASCWTDIYSTGRLAFAPVSEMTEEYIRGAGREQMEALRPGAQQALEDAGGEEGADGDE